MQQYFLLEKNCNGDINSFCVAIDQERRGFNELCFGKQRNLVLHSLHIYIIILILHELCSRGLFAYLDLNNNESSACTQR